MTSTCLNKRKYYKLFCVTIELPRFRATITKQSYKYDVCIIDMFKFSILRLHKAFLSFLVIILIILIIFVQSIFDNFSILDITLNIRNLLFMIRNFALNFHFNMRFCLRYKVSQGNIIFMSKVLLQCPKIWLVNCIAFLIVKSEKIQYTAMVKFGFFACSVD